MTLWRMVLHEIRFRSAGFVMGLLSVAVATAVLVGSVTLLRAHDLRAERVLAARERETRREMERMENDVRRIMRDLGHNVLILHADQRLADLQAAGHPEVPMPEAYVYRLAEGGIETLNHLLPVLQRRVVWPERNVDILLSGTSGQVPVVHLTHFLTADGTAYRSPIVRAIPEGAIRLGHGVAQDLGLRPGDRVTLMGEDLVVERVLPPEGSVDDIAVWANLDQVQAWLGMEGQINGILALECICDPDELGRITEEVQGLLPDVRVIEFSSRIIARAHARSRAEEAHRVAIAAEAEHQANMRRERAAAASVLIPVALAGSGVWIFFLMLGNVRERRTEIGILRALGVRESRIMAVFLRKAVLSGLAGGLLGCMAGVVLGAAWGGVGPGDPAFASLFGLPLLLGALLLAPALSAAAAWLPAARAAHQEPAELLRER